MVLPGLWGSDVPSALSSGTFLSGLSFQLSLILTHPSKGKEASSTGDGQWARGCQEAHVPAAAPGEFWVQKAELQGLSQLSVG